MITLRDIEWAIKQFEILVQEQPERVKANLEDFLAQANVLKDVMSIYIDELQFYYEEFCNDCEEISKLPESNIFLKIRKKEKMRRILYAIQRYTELMEEAYIYKEKMEKVVLRIRQFKAFS